MMKVLYPSFGLPLQRSVRFWYPMMAEKPQLDRFGIAAALQEIAQLMELKGGQYRFKAKAYNAGARAIQGVADLDRLVREDRLTTLPRIGDALASQIKQLYLTGESSVLNIAQRVSKGDRRVVCCARQVSRRSDNFKTRSASRQLPELKAAAEAGELAKAERLWTKEPRSVLLAQISKPVKKPKRRLHLHHALSTAEQALDYLKTLDGVVRSKRCGSAASLGRNG